VSGIIFQPEHPGWKILKNPKKVPKSAQIREKSLTKICETVITVHKGKTCERQYMKAFAKL
jgi:hypothetical protein